ncbi:13078_t:CDS:2, partial [Dentiscutata erythropus]
IIYRNTICIIAATILNFIAGIFGILQNNDTNASLSEIQQLCTKLSSSYLYSSFTGIQVPHLAMIFVFTVFMAALTYFFYKKFGLIEYANFSDNNLHRKPFYAVSEESKNGIFSFMVFWILLAIDLFYLLVAHGSSAAAIGWAFWILFTFKNFGKGLPTYVNHLSLQEYETSLFLQKAKVIDAENHRDMRTWRSEE